MIFARAGKLGDLEERLNHIFQITKGASDNKLIRFIKHYIFGDEKEMLRLLTSEKQVQAAKQVYQYFCTQSQNNCLQCPFPNVIGKYFFLKNTKNAAFPLRIPLISRTIFLPLDSIEKSG